MYANESSGRKSRVREKDVRRKLDPERSEEYNAKDKTFWQKQRKKDQFQRYREVVLPKANRKTKAEVQAEELSTISFDGIFPEFHPASSPLPRVRNTCQDNMTGCWAATDDMDKDTELGYRLRTQNLPFKFETYMDREL